MHGVSAGQGHFSRRLFGQMVPLQSGGPFTEVVTVVRSAGAGQWHTRRAHWLSVLAAPLCAPLLVADQLLFVRCLWHT